jgi:hypothetical protein
MSLDNIVSVTITSEGRGVSRKSFGVPLVIGAFSYFPERYRVYNLPTAAADLVTDGFPTGSPVYKAVSALARNTPKPEKVVVGRLLTAFTHIFDLTVKSSPVTEGQVYSFNLIAPNTGTVTEISYTALVADTAADVADALATLVGAVNNITAPATATATFTATADNTNEQWYITGLDDTLLEFEDKTVDSSLVSELGDITALYPNWYGLILADPNSNARVSALAANIETQERIFGYTTHDTDTGDPVSTTDVAYLLNAALYFRTFGIYSKSQGAHAAATWMGNRFPSDAGSSTWAYKPLSGVTVDIVSASQQTAFEAKSLGWYSEVSGLAVTQEGKMASGEWIDVIRGRDWLKVRMQERILVLLANAPKVPFTDPGIDLVTKEVEAQLQEGIDQTYLAADPIPVVTAPKASDVSAANKTDRILPDVSFEVTLAGAIHKIRINGAIKV